MKQRPKLIGNPIAKTFKDFTQRSLNLKRAQVPTKSTLVTQLISPSKNLPDSQPIAVPQSFPVKTNNFVLWTPYEYYNITTNSWTNTDFGTFVIGGGGGTYFTGDQMWPIQNPHKSNQAVNLSLDTGEAIYQAGFISWQPADDAIPKPAIPLGHAFDFGGRYWWSGSDDNIYYTDDIDSETFFVTYSTSFIPILSDQPQDIVTHPTDMNRIAVSTARTGNYWGMNVTIDRGATWNVNSIDSVSNEDLSKVQFPLWLSDGRLLSCFISNNDGFLYIFHSDNDGSTWIGGAIDATGDIGPTLSDFRCSDIDNSIYIATAGFESYIHRSIDRGITWNRYSVDPSGIDWIGICVKNGILYALLGNGTFYKITNPASTFDISILTPAAHPDTGGFNRGLAVSNLL